RPPRQLNRAIPKELETILLKAVEKSPQTRYATAQELADDLRRFLEDKPIAARRPTLVQRTTKWSRRHRPVVLTVALAVLGLLIVTVVGLAINKKQTEEALLAQTEALARERRSLYFQRIARADLELAAGNVDRAEQILEDCPREYRHWEWSYLKRL